MERPVNESIPERPDNDPPVGDAGDRPDTPGTGQDPAADDGEGPGTSSDRKPGKYYPL